MEEVVYRVNFEFESSLAGKTKIFPGASWFDHVFFFINSSKSAALDSNYKFSSEYLESLNELGVSSTKLKKSKKSINWWSNDTDQQINKKLNSKIEMTRFGIEKKWIPIKSTIGINTLDEYTSPVILREEWGFSGKGTYVLDDPSNKFSRKGNFVVSEYVKKYEDFGITFLLDNNDYFVIKNYIDSKGQFRGGESIDKGTFSELIGEKEVSTLDDIRLSLIKLGAKKTVQVDCFTYENGFHPFVEVNYRKTMGMMIQSLKNLTKSKFVMWKIYKNNKSYTRNEYREKLLEINQNIFITSPIDRFVSICLHSNDDINFRESQIKLDEFLR
mgnify:CR=1 FL=1